MPGNKPVKGVVPKICNWCGKEINLLNMSTWAYKQKYHSKVFYFCSWNCQMKSEKANPPIYVETTGTWIYHEPKAQWQQEIQME